MDYTSHTLRLHNRLLPDLIPNSLLPVRACRPVLALHQVGTITSLQPAWLLNLQMVASVTVVHSHRRVVSSGNY